MAEEMLTLPKFEEASEIVKKVTQETKLVYSKYFSEQTGNKVYLKPENMQLTGAYKLRGAYYKISTLSEEERAKGLITASAGNHAQGVAYAAKCYGAKAVIVMPTTTPLIKVERTQSYGAEVVLYGDVYDEACAKAYELAANELLAANQIGDTEGTAAVTNNNDGTFTITKGQAKVANTLSFNLHVGSDADMTNKITVEIETMSAANLGIKGLNVADETGRGATYAVDAIADAVQKVSEQRSALGAVQNRLEHTIANLDNIVENTTSAESRIRDTDMAETMVEYSKNNILAQAGQSMLAQANQSNQGVLSLLQ
mgnify:CR=1 FL=1